MLTRYPRLRPKAPDVADLKTNFRVGEQAYLQNLKKQENLIAANAKRALKKLDDGQRSQLAALVYDCTVQLKDHAAWASELKSAVKLLKEAERFEKKLSKAKADLLRRLSEFERFSSSIDQRLGQEEIVSRLKQVIAGVEQLSMAYGVGYWMGVRQTLLQSQYYKMVATDPTGIGMAQIFFLLRDGFDITSGEAEVRTGLIRNALWAKCALFVEHVPTVKITSRHLHDQAIGCDAVRKAANRFRFGGGDKAS